MSDGAREFPLPKHWKKACQGRYLGEWNLFDDAKGRHIVVALTIDDMPRGVKYEEVTSERGKEPCLVLRFRGKKLPFIVKSINGKILASQFGSLDPRAWAGKTFKLGTEQKKVKGVMAHVLRVMGTSARGEELKEQLAEPEPEDTFEPAETPDREPGSDDV
jgi:hypothetical protein